MSFLYDWMPLAPLTDKEIFGIRVSIKEEFNEDVSEETCVDIKEEPFEYTDEVSDELSDLEVKCELPPSILQA